MSEQREAAVDVCPKCGAAIEWKMTREWMYQCRSHQFFHPDSFLVSDACKVNSLTATVAKLQADLNSIYAMAEHLKVCKTRDAAAVVGGLSRWHAEFGAIQDTLDGSQAEVAKLQAELAAARELLDMCADAPLKLDIAKQSLAKLQAEITRLKADLAAARRDEERLDWLLANPSFYRWRRYEIDTAMGKAGE